MFLVLKLLKEENCVEVMKVVVIINNEDRL